MRSPSPTYIAYAIAKHKSLDAHAAAFDAVEHCAWRRGVWPTAARMGPDLAADVGELPVPVIVDASVPVRYLYFELPEGSR